MAGRSDTVWPDGRSAVGVIYAVALDQREEAAAAAQPEPERAGAAPAELAHVDLAPAVAPRGPDGHVREEVAGGGDVAHGGQHELDAAQGLGVGDREVVEGPKDVLPRHVAHLRTGALPPLRLAADGHSWQLCTQDRDAAQWQRRPRLGPPR